MEELSFKVAAFEGPLDLLLHLISKNKVNIYDIPIAEITDQYLEYIDAMRELDMDVGGEFLVMASQLLLIKSRMLLPVENEEEEDPRLELADRLEEYRRYKLISEEMEQLSHFADNLVFKESEPLDFPKIKIENKSLEVDKLYSAFMTVLERGRIRASLEPKSFRRVIGRTNYSVREASNRIIHLIAENDTVEFEDLFEGMYYRGEMVAAFLAVLELMKENYISVEEVDGKLYCLRGEKEGELELGEEY